MNALTVFFWRYASGSAFHYIWTSRQGSGHNLRLAMTYFNIVDQVGHSNGTTSAALNVAMAEADAAIGYLLSKLEHRKNRTDLIIVGDHGMADITTYIVIDVEWKFDASRYVAFFYGPNLMLWLRPEIGTIYHDSQSINCR